MTELDEGDLEFDVDWVDPIELDGGDGAHPPSAVGPDWAPSAPDWARSAVQAKEKEKAKEKDPPSSQPSRVSKGMTDRMRAIEALSTIAPAVATGPDSDAFCGESFVSVRRARLTPTRVGVVSATLSALMIAAIHLATSADANGQPEVTSAAPIEILAVAAVDIAPPDSTAAGSPQIADVRSIDNERARKLGTIGLRALEEGRNATAKRMLDRALLANPRNRLALAGLGRYALGQRRYTAAAEYLELAVKVEPRKADNRRYLGDEYAGLGRVARARQQYNKAEQCGDTIATQRLAALP